MKPAMTQNNGGRFVDVRLHRPAFTLDEACADEGAWIATAAPDLYEAPKVTQPAEEGPPPAGSIYWAVVAASLVFACYLIGVHVLASWGPKAGEIWVVSGYEDKGCTAPRVKILEVFGSSVRTMLFSDKTYIFEVQPMRNFLGPFSHMKVDPYNCRPQHDFSYPQS